MFFKNFLQWFQIKPVIHEKKGAPSFSEREVWMCHFGVNIGFELDGKKDELLRPVLVVKKLSHETFLAIPLSTGKKEGTWYSPSFVQNREGRYCLNQIRMIDRKRLKYRIERIDESDFEKVKKDFLTFLEF